jgi:hypothetical protein
VGRAGEIICTRLTGDAERPRGEALRERALFAEPVR